MKIGEQVTYSESMEILREVERIRPDWFRTHPDIPFFNQSRDDWRKILSGFWARCKVSPESEAWRLAPFESVLIPGARAQAQNARREMIDAEWKRNPPMDKTFAAFESPMPGWRGEPFEAWRMDSWASLTHALGWQGNPYRDWIAPFVEVDDGLLRSSAWVEFWIHLADKTAMPRQWIRWAFSFAQRFRRVTPGTPGDSQLSTYFLETDVVISADKVFLEILDEIRPYAPCDLPVGRLVPGGSAGVSALFEYLNGKDN